MDQHQVTRSNKLHPLWWSFALALLLHFLCYWVWGMFYNEYTDKFFTAYVDGSFDSGTPKAVFYNYGYLTIISQLMAWLYGLWPSLNWYGIIVQAIMVFTTGGFLFLLQSLYLSVAKHKWLVGLASVSLLPFWIYHIVLYRTTELAFLAFGVSSMVLILSFTSALGPAMGKLRSVRAYFLILFLISTLVRVEPILMSSIIWVPYGLIAWNHKAQRKAVLKVLLVTVVCVGGSYGLYMSTIGAGSAMFKERRVYNYTIWDFGQADEHLNLNSAADSIKLKAAQQFFVSDKYEMNGAFYQRIGILPLEKSVDAIPGFLLDIELRVDKALHIWRSLLAGQWVMFAAAIVLFIGASLLLLLNGRYKQWAFMLALQLWFYLVLFAVTVFMKMELRVLCPLLTLNMILIVSLIFVWVDLNAERAKVNTTILNLTLVSLVVLGVFKFNELRSVTADYQVGAKNIRAFKKELLAEHGDKTIIFNSICWQLLRADLFDNNELQADMQLLAFDNGELYMYPTYDKTMQQWCGSDHLSDIAKAIVEKKEEVLFVSTVDRMHLIEDYLRIVYGVDLNVLPVYPNSALSDPPFSDKMIPSYLDHHDFSYFVVQGSATQQ